MAIQQQLETLLQIMMSSKYTTSILILLAALIFAIFIIKIIVNILLKFAAKTKTKMDDDLINALKKPTSSMIVLIGIRIFFINIWGGLLFEEYVRHTLDSFIIIVITFTAIKVFDIIIYGWGLTFAKKTNSRLDDQLIRLFHQFATVGAYIVGFLAILDTWGVKIGPLLAGIGIGGLAVAFALQPILSNIFGGVALILDKTIRVGDIIKLDSGESGIVYDVGLRSTRVKTWTNEILILPNSKLVDSRVTNFNQPDRSIRVDINFGVAYGSDLEKVKKLALSCLKKEKHILKEPEPAVWFMEMGDSALKFLFKFYVDDLDNKWSTHQKIIAKLYDTLNKNKISIPFPQREVWMHNLKK